MIVKSSAWASTKVISLLWIQSVPHYLRIIVGGNVTITHYALDLTIQGPFPNPYFAPLHYTLHLAIRGPPVLDLPPGHVTSLYRDSYFSASPVLGDNWWPRMQTCSNLFTWGSHLCWHMVATVAHTVDKWALRILLECFLALSVFYTLQEEHSVLTSPYMFL